MKKTLCILELILLILCLHSLSWASGLGIGTDAPFFKVISGDGQILTLKDIKGKAAGIFYETTDVVKQNMPLKEELGKYYQTQPAFVRELIVRLPVISCSRIFWPLAVIYRSQFRKHSRIEGITIYGDWNGKMFLDYNIEDNKSNVFLIDKNGVIRYYAVGKIEGKEVERVISLFKKLVEE